MNLSVSINSDKIILIIGHQKQNVINFISSNYKTGNIDFAHQDEQLGTGHAVMQTSELLKGFRGNVLILSGDVPLLKQSTVESFFNYHIDNGFDASLISANFNDPSGYGRIIRDSKGNFINIMEDKDADENEKRIKEINSGIYIINSLYLFKALKTLKADNSQKEYYLTDVFCYFKNEGLKIGAFIVGDNNEINGIKTVEQLESLENLIK